MPIEYYRALERNLKGSLKGFLKGKEPFKGTLKSKAPLDGILVHDVPPGVARHPDHLEGWRGLVLFFLGGV